MAHHWITLGGRGGSKFWIDDATRERLGAFRRSLGARVGVEEVSQAGAALVLLDAAGRAPREMTQEELREALSMLLKLRGF